MSDNKIQQNLDEFLGDEVDFSQLSEMGIRNKKLFQKFQYAHLEQKPTVIETQEQQLIEILKCKYNILYYIKNYARFPLPGGSSTKIMLNEKLMTVALLYQASVKHIFQTSRQSSKTTIEIVCTSWYVNFWENVKILFFNKEDRDNKKNLRDVKRVLALLPKWMQTYDPKRDPNNVNSFLNGLSAAIELITINRESPDSTGRGNTAALYLDEFGFLKNIHIAFGQLGYITSTYSRLARRNYGVSPFAITSTPADPSEPEGHLFMEMWFKAFEVTYDDIKDMLPHEIYQYVADNSDDFLAKVFQHWYEFPGRCKRSLYDENNPENILHLLQDPFVDLNELAEYDSNAVEYIRESRSRCKTKTELRREVYCEFLTIANMSIFEEEFLESIPKTQPQKIIKLPNTHNSDFKLYKKISEYDMLKTQYALCIDPAYQLKGDFAAIILFNLQTKEIDGSAKVRVGRIKKVSEVVSFLGNMFRNAVIIIEKNNFGQAIIEDLLENPEIKPRLYFTFGKKKEQNLTSYNREDSKVYGIQTDKSSRPKMIEALKSYVETYPERLHSHELISELAYLQEKSNGRVEAAPGRHDDMVMALSFILYILDYAPDTLKRFLRIPADVKRNINQVSRLNQAEIQSDSQREFLKNIIQDPLNPQLLQHMIDHIQATVSNEPYYDSAIYGLDRFKKENTNMSAVALCKDMNLL